MNTQKIKNKKIIDFIYWILTILLGTGGLILVFSALLFFLTLLNPNFEPFFPIVDIPLEVEESATLELKNGKAFNILVDEVNVSFNINNSYGFAGVLNYLYFISILIIAFYIILLLWKIFKSIRSSLKNENPFHLRNVWRIRKIALAILFSAILEILYPLILKYVWFEKLNMLDKAFSFKLNFEASINLFWALIVMVIAEIYRIGIEKKKEQELTI